MLAPLPLPRSPQPPPPQILYNLVGNAAKFTRQGVISITAGVSEDAAKVYVTVADTGVGIPKEKISKIFGAFEQVGATGESSMVQSACELKLPVTAAMRGHVENPSPRAPPCSSVPCRLPHFPPVPSAQRPFSSSPPLWVW